MSVSGIDSYRRPTGHGKPGKAGSPLEGYLSRLRSAAVAAAAAAWIGIAASATPPPEPEALSTCPSPQALGDGVGLGGLYVSARQGAVWNGREYVVAYADSYSSPTLRFQRVFADGTPNGPAFAPPGFSSYSFFNFPVSLAFDGTRYGVAYMGPDNSSGYWQVYFATLGADFSLQSGPTRVSNYGGTAGQSASWPQVAAAGNGWGFCVVWTDGRSGYSQVYGTLLSAAGTVMNGGAAHDIPLENTTSTQDRPTVGWSRYGANGTGGYVVSWADDRSGIRFDIRSALLFGLGAVNFWNTTVQPPSGSAILPHLATTPGGLGLVWSDTRNGNSDVFYLPLTSLGYAAGTPVQLTTDPASQSYPYLLWTGSEFGAFWSDNRSPSGYPSDLWFQRLSSGGALQGQNLQVTSGLNAAAPAAAFGTRGYLVLGDASEAQNYATPFGCSTPSPPSCPEGLVAYGVSGTGATLSWLPSADPSAEIAYYQVYRNSQPLARTAFTYHTDSGLSPGATYAYSVRAVNAASLTSSGCGSGASVYVRTNATLTLTLDKSAPDAVLSWTDSEPLGSYRVFRGTDPQVMQELATASGATYSDSGVLNDAVLYFYTVDAPGLL